MQLRFPKLQESDSRAQEIKAIEQLQMGKIHDVFSVSLQEQDIIQQGQVKETQLKLDISKNKEYKVKAIWDSAVYARELKGHLLGFYYLVLGKGYLKEKNTGEPSGALQHLRKMISFFHKDHLDKLTMTNFAVNTALSMAKPIAKPTKPVVQ